MAETDKVDDIEFKWGKKRQNGVKRKDIQFYESFTYEGIEYTLYDCVYMHKDGEPEPYIGKLIKAWELADKSKRVKTQWFFRPCEILRWIGDDIALEKEIFLATGKGIGLTNVNPLEAIAGKVNVVCISKDSRNRQPSEEELKMADYIFYRTFDVGLYTVVDKMDDKIGVLESKFVFNKKDSESTIPKLDSDTKEDNGNAIVCNGKQQLSTNTLDEYNKPLKTDGDHNRSVAANCESLPGVKPATGSGVNPNELATTSTQEASATGQKDANCKLDAVKGEVRKVTDRKVKSEERVESAEGTDVLDDKPAKKARRDNSVKSPVEKDFNSPQNLLVHGIDMKTMLIAVGDSEEKTKSGRNNDPLRKDNGVKSIRESSDSEDRPSKKVKVVDSSIKEKAKVNSSFKGKAKVDSSIGENAKVDSSLKGKAKVDSSIREHAKVDSSIRENAKVDSSIRENAKVDSSLREKAKVDYPIKEKAKVDSSIKEKVKVDSSTKEKAKVDSSTKEKAKVDSSIYEKVKVDSSIEEKNRNNIQKASVNSEENHAKDLVKSSTSYGERTKNKLAIDSFGSPSNTKKLDEKTRKASGGKLPKISAPESAYEDDIAEGKVLEVTRKPEDDKRKWFKTLPWEERMRNGHEQGTLVLLHNLDPEYTSGEVEDIIYHAFKESCSAKMLQRTTISSPHSGQAIAIFKTKAATAKVMRRLYEGCLMLPNGRPLVCTSVPKFQGKQSTYIGHLVVNNAKKLQGQRDMKDAVSTSHCSQPNTIEYDMAMEWCLLQAKSDICWKSLYEQQGKQLRKLKANLKSK